MKPTTVGPTIWPAAKATVKVPMPAAHWLGGRLWRTSAVVEATTDRNTPPNSRPETITSGQAVVTAGSSVATPSNAFSSASAWPFLWRSSRPAQMRDEAITASPSSAKYPVIAVALVPCSRSRAITKVM